MHLCGLLALSQALLAGLRNFSLTAQRGGFTAGTVLYRVRQGAV